MRQVFVAHVPVRLDRAEVQRYAGFPRGSRVPANVEGMLDALMADAPRIVKPAAVYRLFAVERPVEDPVRLRDGPVLGGRGLMALLRESEYACAFVVTAGEGIAGAAKEAIDRGRFTEGLLLDAIGSAAVESAADHLQELAAREGPPPGGGRRMFTQRFSPGYCDWPLEEQRRVFAALDPAQAGVTLTESLLMVPEKSVSAVFGISPAGVAAFETRRRPPCRGCGAQGCTFRLTVER